MLDQLLKVADKLGVREYFEERIRPVMLAGTKNAVGKRVTVEDVTVEITGFKVEWVSLEGAKRPCSWSAEPCRPNVVIKYRADGEEQVFNMTWKIKESGRIEASVKMANRLDKAAALVAVAVWEGDEEEKKRILDKARGGDVVTLTLSNLLAMAQYDESLLEWVMFVKKTKAPIS